MPERKQQQPEEGEGKNSFATFCEEEILVPGIIEKMRAWCAAGKPHKR